MSAVKTEDEILAERLRPLLAGQPGLVEKRMFGGIGYLVQGNMACGINSGELIVRVGSQRHAEALSRPHAREFDLTGRPMQGWVWVAQPGFATEEELRHWVGWGLEYALSLPPK